MSILLDLSLQFHPNKQHEVQASHKGNASILGLDLGIGYLGIIDTTDTIFFTLMTLKEALGAHHQKVNEDVLKISGCGGAYSEKNANVSTLYN